MLKYKKAFTMLELVFAIVIIGILASLAMPKIDREMRQEAADNILSAIRYTQHLALMDDKSRPATTDTLAQNQWQKGLWHIRFETYLGGKWFYNISASRDGNSNVDTNEVALDPTNGLRMDNTNSANGAGTNDSPNVFLTENYGVNSVDFSNCTGSIGSGQVANDARHVAFDYFGRPHKGIYGATNNYATTMHANCTISFGFLDSNIEDLNITIEAETGHAFIVGQPDS